jgi:phosphoglycolate phosphatase
MTGDDAARTLVLFDVDQTLIDTLGAGIDAVALAGRELVGEHFDERIVDYAGRLDPVIFRDVLAAHDAPSGEEDVARFRARYAHHLPGAIDGYARVCPGARELVDALEPIDRVTLGLLTGNFEETGTIKLRACGIDPERFDVRVWSSCVPGPAPTREQMPPVGIERWRALLDGDAPTDPRRVVVIGDTVHDVACASANGCRSICVATGRYETNELVQAGADLVVESLEETAALVRWITEA